MSKENIELLTFLSVDKYYTTMSLSLDKLFNESETRRSSVGRQRVCVMHDFSPCNKAHI